ncbi:MULTISPECIES: DoxX family protein [Saccharothrix]|uniref:DoxX family protein n=1 Tax=Saccharothrix TaxID=2071 RepID=UPI00093C6265|nr:DoxX family protein [Saccharothrix sp. CB00851]OKI29016.1 DoxX family protein [Saccharothrix sp. CB00851]
MEIALWIGQVLPAAVFLMSGAAKSTQSKERMPATGQTGVAFLSLPAIRVVAALEVAAAIGVVVPWATGIAPVLTPIAAVGLGLVMVGAAYFHARLREPRAVAVNVLLLAVAVFVAVGRFGAA